MTAWLLLACADPSLPAQSEVVDLPDPAAVERGEAIYVRCEGCHSLDRNRTGPKHCGVVGRPAGTAEGFDYSEAMGQADRVWNEADLDAFLLSPANVVPGTAMTFAGVPDADERADLIAFLSAAGDDPSRSPP